MHAHAPLGAASVTLAPPAPLTLDMLGNIADGATVVLGPLVRSRVEASHRYVSDLGRSDRPVYGLTTGCGPLVDHEIAARGRLEFQRKAVLAHPASLGSVPTNANNQDVVGMGGVAVRQARRLLENARRVVAIELVAAAEAADLVGPALLARGTRAVHGCVRQIVPPLVEDRPLGRDVERLVQVLARVAPIE